ncbi:Type I restriction enzyme, S subunit [Desulfamplus magnetovallimortis]|uniref:Type I restriction enzyme, S subunit n=1 Tax=Desulfamplus magnetovallimortis TaxID=1246637 RepID=A0A1W1HGM0_9BACT|nr:restriction endonuclease subunit S [Desulfamplus magnetovallimortis]SLM31624.1 Type I restriction enzyme, S subunit [Desulfamplus magnetovallimortis]
MEGRYQRYPEYKDSGVKWFGKIPIGWLPSRLKYIANINMGQSPSSDDCNKDGKGRPFLQGNAEFGVEYPEPQNYCDVSKKVAKVGDLLFSVRAPVGALNIADQAYGIARGLCSIAVSNEIYRRYLWWLIPTLRKELDTVSTGSTFEAVSAEQIRNVICYYPILADQHQIANFLDHETAKIDTLIEKQQQLISLLKEKRQAVISHAVTKGLNPDAPMKDSGLEWLGEVPEHWEVKCLRHIGICQNGINIGAEFFGTGYPFVSYSDVYNNRVLPESVSGLVQSKDADWNAYSVRSGDVFFTRTSETIDEIGFASTCKKTINKATFAGFLIRFRPNRGEIVDKFSTHYFGNSLLRAFFIKEMNLVTRASLSQDLLKKLPVLLPPREEQIAIAEYLDDRVRVYAGLITKSHLMVELLQERRTALISSAVTGKIDVRNWQPPTDSITDKDIQ